MASINHQIHQVDLILQEHWIIGCFEYFYHESWFVQWSFTLTKMETNESPVISLSTSKQQKRQHLVKSISVYIHFLSNLSVASWYIIINFNWMKKTLNIHHHSAFHWDSCFEQKRKKKEKNRAIYFFLFFLHDIFIQTFLNIFLFLFLLKPTWFEYKIENYPMDYWLEKRKKNESDQCFSNSKRLFLSSIH